MQGMGKLKVNKMKLFLYMANIMRNSTKKQEIAVWDDSIS